MTRLLVRSLGGVTFVLFGPKGWSMWWERILDVSSYDGGWEKGCVCVCVGHERCLVGCQNSFRVEGLKYTTVWFKSVIGRNIVNDTKLKLLDHVAIGVSCWTFNTFPSTNHLNIIPIHATSTIITTQHMNVSFNNGLSSVVGNTTQFVSFAQT
jgi:hypothetical protein